ncbi:glycoside hydrolase family 13 protein [Rhodococcus sp. X156]|uniref:glycoside hydrolase family 13 protein n=1 Tax=Rhodococcus sp. X156 TaxID=2499145 RepID=UPI000FD6E045|nr:glycoside hydrolase family 13 protein [Rhodococcus sp. X156]
MTEPTPAHSWWRDAVIYQVYPRSWADSDGDGLGDLPGITAHLPHLVELGVDALWLSPFYPSPQHDAGYDVADYYGVDPRFGTLADADALLTQAHALGLRVIVDVVPNHSSSEHPWFQQALASPPGSPQRARYLFRNGRGPDGAQPPNNWQSTFGGSAWERVTEADGTPGQWYLHLFDVTQPDFDWTNPEVATELERVLRFWLDRGVDGFRVDVAHGLVKAAGLPDAPSGRHELLGPTADQPMWDQPGVHEIYRSWRKLADSYGGAAGAGGDVPGGQPAGEDSARILVAEAWVSPSAALARYVRPDEMHQSFNFPYLMTPWLAEGQRSTITDALAAVAPYDAPQTWVLSNHDVVRHASRLGYPQHPGLARIAGIGPDDPQPDAQLGLRRARAATTVMLALPGSAYLYQGEELGLPEATRLPDEVRQDPTWFRSGDTNPGRDGCRVPMPWVADAPACGFSPTGRSWLPQPPEYAALAVDQQRGVVGSTLELYRTLLRTRKELALGRGTLTWVPTDHQHLLAFDVRTATGPVRVLANVGGPPVPLPAGAQVLVCSAAEPVTDVLPTDTTVWLRP